MKNNILSNFFANRIILLITLVYYLIAAAIFLLGLINKDFVFGFFQKYADTAHYTIANIQLFFGVELFLHLLMVISLFFMWFRPAWLHFLTLIIVNLIISILHFYMTGISAFRTIIFEWVLMVLIGISFSALVISHLIKLKRLAKAIANQDAFSTKKKDEDIESTKNEDEF